MADGRAAPVSPRSTPRHHCAPPTEALAAFGVAAEHAATGALGPGSFHVNLYDAVAALDPETLDSEARIEFTAGAARRDPPRHRADAGTAAWAARHGAPVVQLRLKDVPTALRVQVGRQVIAGVGGLALIVLNDDLEAAQALGVAVHLGLDDPGVEIARRARDPLRSLGGQPGGGSGGGG